jgi:ubiquitin-protein ligase|tara:strand:+ start:163 stop:879 length:717 start_codon:yes stop_codon:yes gene_type:complete
MAEVVNQVIKKETIRRLVKDVREIIKNPLEEHGIYYFHNETDMLKGQAMVIGPKGTPYENGYYFFELDFPADYPHSPPKVTYFTNDGMTRFNPNLYKSGKVCISVLNTWRGEQWTACQTISSILLVLCTTLNNEPLLNEPGVRKNHRDYDSYHQIITYKNFRIAIVEMLKGTMVRRQFPLFSDIIKKNFVDNYNDIMKNLDTGQIENITLRTSLYNMTVSINYEKVKEELNTLYQKLK